MANETLLKSYIFIDDVFGCKQRKFGDTQSVEGFKKYAFQRLFVIYVQYELLNICFDGAQS